MNGTDRRVECHTVDRITVNLYPGRSELVPRSHAIFAFVHYRIFPIIRRTPIKSRVKFADFKINAGSVYKGPLVLSRSRRGRGHKDWLQLGISEASQAHVTSVFCKF